MNSKQTEGTACNLSNAELIDRVEKWVHKLAETGGQAWTLRVPVDFNLDPDMLIIEVCKRFSASLPSKPVGDVEEMATVYANDSEWGYPVDETGEFMFNVIVDAFKSGYAAAPQKGMEFVEWQLCPKCNGDGNLARYNSPSIIGTDAALLCDICKGAKMIPKIALDESPSPSEAGDGWVSVEQYLPGREDYYEVKFEDGTIDEKPFRIRYSKNILGFMTESKVAHWRPLVPRQNKKQ